MSSSSMEAVGIAVVLGVVAVAALLPCSGAHAGHRQGLEGDDHRDAAKRSEGLADPVTLRERPHPLGPVGDRALASRRARLP